MAGPGTSRLRTACDAAGTTGAADGDGTGLPADGVTTAGADVGSAADAAGLEEVGNLGKLTTVFERIKLGGMVIPSIASIADFGSGVEGITGPDVHGSKCVAAELAMVAEPPKSMGSPSQCP